MISTGSCGRGLRVWAVDDAGGAWRGAGADRARAWMRAASVGGEECGRSGRWTGEGSARDVRVCVGTNVGGGAVFISANIFFWESDSGGGVGGCAGVGKA